MTSIFNALFTTFGPAISTSEVSVITEKCEATRRDAGRPATGPNAAVATGTSPKVLASEINREGVYTASLVGRLLFYCLVPPTDPPAPSCNRIKGTLYFSASSSV